MDQITKSIQHILKSISAEKLYGTLDQADFNNRFLGFEETARGLKIKFASDGLTLDK